MHVRKTDEMKATRREFLRTATLGTAALSAGLFTVGRSHAQAQGRVVMLGYDGMVPSVVEAMLVRGELPNLQRLRDMGAYCRLTSTIPPQSPWPGTPTPPARTPADTIFSTSSAARPKDHAARCPWWARAS